MTEDDILAAEDVIAASDMVLLQLETNDESLITTVNLAVKHGVKVMLNPAPYREFPLEILRGVDYITPNRAEASAITGVKVTDDASALAAAEVLSSMGAGNKLNPAMFEVADIYKTSVCPLAKVMRRELKKRGVKKLKVVYSREQPVTPIEDMSISCRAHCICPPGAKHKCTERRAIPGSNAFVPSVAGLIIASEVIKDLAAE